jgi:GNAT superfamily N-acetyltransferase
MALVVRQPRIDDLPILSNLCMRSKAVWGYDQQFMEACRGELSFDPDDLKSTQIAVAEDNANLVGVAQVKVVDSEADLLKLFVAPGTLRSGIGRVLFNWASDVARNMGAERLFIDADPDAAPFYRRMGAYDVGLSLSGSIPGRLLPKLALDLQPIR